MPEYMLLLYGSESADEAERARRWAEMPLWDEVNASLRDAGVLVAHAPLHSVESATTVRVRGDETELTDGPFAVTKEVLAGYYVLDCADLDVAIRHASRLPWARYGSVEVRPILPDDEIPRLDRSASG
ncbi:MAG: YciI family protein [Solirubrobacteraceae bacterium]